MRRAGEWHRTAAGLALALLGVGALPEEIGAALAVEGGGPDGLCIPLAGRR